jgi:N-acetylmuramoyl-L-alanine amidase
MSKYLYLLDPGHGGLINGQYSTPGKRSPKFEDGSVLYEGVNNRDNVNRIMNALQKLGIDCVDIVNDNKDISLTERVARANKLHPTRKCIYISIHSDAHQYYYIDKACTIRYDVKVHGKRDTKTMFQKSPIEWTEANGISVYTSPGQTPSDPFAQIWIDELEAQFGNTVTWRKDKSDGDEDKEAHFYVLKETNMPAVLGELGFHTNLEQARRMQTDEWKNKVVASVVNAILKWEKQN